MAFSSGGRTQTSLADINMTPLIDVVLVLLLIFMLTAPVLQSGIDVAVPKTRSVNQVTEERQVVTINKDQVVYLQDKQVNINDLPTLLRSGYFCRTRLLTSTSCRHYCGPALPIHLRRSSTCARMNAFPSVLSPR